MADLLICRQVQKGFPKRLLVGPLVGLNFYSSGPLTDIGDIFLVGTTKKCSKGFAECLKSVKPPKGSYLAHSVDDKRYLEP